MIQRSFGILLKIGDKDVIKLKYTDSVLATRVVRYLTSRGYYNNLEINEYSNKGKLCTQIKGTIYAVDTLQIMAIKQRRVAEIALNKAEILTINSMSHAR